MIRIIFIVFVVSLLVVFTRNGYCQTYPIPASGSQWGCVTMLGPPGLPGSGLYGNIEKYSIIDTVIQNVTYQHWASVYSRYENNRLLLLDLQHSKSDSLVEKVCYDFNLAVNDSFLISEVHKYAKVIQVTTFLTLNSQVRKRILLRVNDCPCGSQLDWIEGIGDISNSVFYAWQIGTCDIYRRVVCFFDSSGQVYLENGFTFPCDSLDSYVSLFDTTKRVNVTTNRIKQRISYPNPFSTEIRIDLVGLSEFKAVSLFNAAGILVEKTDQNVIHTGCLKPGVYILKIEFGKEISYRKMIKN